MYLWHVFIDSTQKVRKSTLSRGLRPDQTNLKRGIKVQNINSGMSWPAKSMNTYTDFLIAETDNPQETTPTPVKK